MLKFLKRFKNKKEISFILGFILFLLLLSRAPSWGRLGMKRWMGCPGRIAEAGSRRSNCDTLMGGRPVQAPDGAMGESSLDRVDRQLRVGL